MRQEVKSEEVLLAKLTDRKLEVVYIPDSKPRGYPLPNTLLDTTNFF